MPIRLFCIAASFAMVCVSALADDPSPKRPNFIFVYTDDQRWDALGVVQREMGERARFPWFESPNMDRIAAEGVRFRNAFVVHSLCSPSRATFLTGTYSHVHGVINNRDPFPDNAVTFATLLRDAGYATSYIGKWHHGKQSGQRPGFDHSASFIDQGVYFDCPFEINGELTATTGWTDDVTTDFAIEYLRENHDRPFVMVVGYKSSHDNRIPPPRAEERFAGERPRPAPNANVPAPYRDEIRRAQQRRGPPTGRAAQRGREQYLLDYFRTLSAVDESIGRLLDAIDELNLRDDTALIFTSDNGYFLGEHMLGDKRAAYDESLRIPLLMRYPRMIRAGEVRDEMVLNTDIAPTLLDLAGVSVPQFMQGQSLRPLLQGKTVPWRQSFFYAYFYERPYGTPTITAVRTTSAKLIKYPDSDEWNEMFDLEQDPYELKNLIDDASASNLRQQLEREYDAQAQAVGFHIPDHADKPE